MALIGTIELLPVTDAVPVPATYAEAFPEARAEEWEPYRELYPELFADDGWRVPCRCFVVRSEGATILVDTGIGPPGLVDWAFEEEGVLPNALDAIGVGREDVDIVFLTHLHIDHLGWNTDTEGTPFFPGARYVVHQDALAFARSRAELPHVRRCVEPLADRFEARSDDVELVPGVSPFAAPGHYPGHMGLRLASQGSNAMLLSDIAVHPTQLDRPDLGYVFDVDVATSVATRRAILPELVDRDVLVSCGHYPGTGIGRVIRQEGRVVWIDD